MGDTGTFLCKVDYVGTYPTWADLFYCIRPESWGYMGIAMALGFSIIGASW